MSPGSKISNLRRQLERHATKAVTREDTLKFGVDLEMYTSSVNSLVRRVYNIRKVSPETEKILRSARDAMETVAENLYLVQVKDMNDANNALRRASNQASAAMVTAKNTVQESLGALRKIHESIRGYADLEQAFQELEQEARKVQGH